MQLLKPNRRHSYESLKSSASGLSVLFFWVTKASGLVVVGSSIGSDLNSRLFGGNCMTTRGTIDKKRPVASTSFGQAASNRRQMAEPVIRGREMPQRRVPYGCSGSGSTHGSSTSCAKLMPRRRTIGWCAPATTTCGSCRSSSTSMSFWSACRLRGRSRDRPCGSARRGRRSPCLSRGPET